MFDPVFNYYMKNEDCNLQTFSKPGLIQHRLNRSERSSTILFFSLCYFFYSLFTISENTLSNVEKETIKSEVNHSSNIIGRNLNLSAGKVGLSGKQNHRRSRGTRAICCAGYPARRSGWDHRANDGKYPLGCFPASFWNFKTERD